MSILASMILIFKIFKFSMVQLQTFNLADLINANVSKYQIARSIWECTVDKHTGKSLIYSEIV